jgi:predicted cupin superfamily sugar epimerase
MIDDLTADEVRRVLKLEPHATCGFVRVSFISKKHIAPGGLPPPFVDGRPAGSALYFMVTPDAPVRLHRIRNDQLYHYYLGDPIEVLLAAHRRDERTRYCGPRFAQRTPLTASHPRRYVSYRAGDWRSALVPRREHRMARRRAC